MKVLTEVAWKDYTKLLMIFGCSVILLLVSAGTRYSIKTELDDSQLRYKNQLKKNTDARYALDTLSLELDNYLGYRLKGFIGEPMRLNWVENVQSIANTFRVPNLQYTLDKTVKADISYDPQADELIAIDISRMRLFFELKHELDFANVLSSLAGNAKGLFSADMCRVSRSMVEVDEFGAPLNGECELTWYNVDDVITHWGEVDE